MPGADSFGVRPLFRASHPVVVEVLAPGLVGAGLPRLRRSARTRAHPAPGDVGSEEAFRLLNLLDRLHAEFDTRVVIHLIEPFSFAWIVRVLRYRPARFPAFIVGGRTAVAGLDEHGVREAIASSMGPA
ncbi:MAG: hypothetical protein QN120_01510 [Armatimonadota bacterium]|nr:hypothetical protein [Armatimonadota bacterium]